MCGVCVLFSTPLVFIAGSHGVKPSQPMQATNGEMPHALVEAVGPTGQFGRLSRLVGLPGPPTAPNFFWQAVLGLLVYPHWGWPVLTSFGLVLASLLVHLSLNRCSDNFCDFMSGQSVLVTYILA